MDLTLLVGEHFNSKKTSSVWKVTEVDNLHDKVTVKEVSKKGTYLIEYIKFKERFESGACEFIDGPSYANWGSVVKKEHTSLFNKVEGSITAKRVGVGQWNTYTPTNTNPLWNMQYVINDTANRIYGEFKKEYKKPNCECGAHAIGVKDYQGGHAHYCPVSHKT